MPRTDPACPARQAATRCCLLILLLNLQRQTKKLYTNTQYTNTNKQIQKMTTCNPPVAKQFPSGCFTSLLLIKVQYTPHLANQIFSICHLFQISAMPKTLAIMDSSIACCGAVQMEREMTLQKKW